MHITIRKLVIFITKRNRLRISTSYKKWYIYATDGTSLITHHSLKMCNSMMVRKKSQKSTLVRKNLQNFTLVSNTQDIGLGAYQLSTRKMYEPILLRGVEWAMITK